MRHRLLVRAHVVRDTQCLRRLSVGHFSGDGDALRFVRYWQQTRAFAARPPACKSVFGACRKFSLCSSWPCFSHDEKEHDICQVASVDKHRDTQNRLPTHWSKPLRVPKWGHSSGEQFWSPQLKKNPRMLEYKCIYWDCSALPRFGQCSRICRTEAPVVQRLTTCAFGCGIALIDVEAFDVVLAPTRIGGSDAISKLLLRVRACIGPNAVCSPAKCAHSKGSKGSLFAGGGLNQSCSTDNDARRQTGHTHGFPICKARRC